MYRLDYIDNVTDTGQIDTPAPPKAGPKIQTMTFRRDFLIFIFFVLYIRFYRFCVVFGNVF